MASDNANTTDSVVTQVVERSYVDNYAIKDFVVNQLVAKYFPDMDVTLRSVGMLGLTSELLTNIAEDTFNATSVLYREAFPNRAEIPESIYSHAAIFQLSNAFSSSAECSFLIIIEEASIVENMVHDIDTGINYFYISKNLVVYVEDVPYTLDYDIRIRCVKKNTNRGEEEYIFSAFYVLDEYKNSISSITQPFIKVRRSRNGFMAIEVKMHQCERDVRYESIITNTKINLPSIDIEFEGQLAGFDVLYKTPSDDGFNTQLQTLLVYSRPLITPFCYYQLYSDNVLRLTFNSNELYFTPQFNSELEVILYISRGSKGNFDVYNGDNTRISFNDINRDDNTLMMTAKPLGSSIGGNEQLSLDALQDITVEAYRTANALTTESDLQEFFSNYKYYYGELFVKFIKRRNDVYERVFGGYLMVKKDDYVYKANTLDIDTNLSDIEDAESGTYIIPPGTLFVYKYSDNNSLVDFYHDEELEKSYKEEYDKEVEAGTALYVTKDSPLQETEYSDRAMSFAEWKKRKGYNTNVSVFDITYEEGEALDNPIEGKFLFINPFLMRIKKSPNLVSLYLSWIDQKSSVDFTNQNQDSFMQFIIYQCELERYFTNENKYTITTITMPSVSVDPKTPLIANIGTDPTTKKEISNLGNRYDTELNDLRLVFVIYEAGRAIAYSEMYPVEMSDADGTNIKFLTDFCTNDMITNDGHLKIVPDVIYRNQETKEYYRAHKDDATKYTKYDKDGYVLEDNVEVNTVTEGTKDGTLRKFSDIVSMSNSDTILVPMEDVTCRIYTLYNRIFNDELGQLEYIEKGEGNNIFSNFDDSFDGYIWTNEYSTELEPLTFLKPLHNVRCNLFFDDYLEQDEDGNYKNEIMDIRLQSVPFISWDLAFNENGLLTYFMNAFAAHYKSFDEIIHERIRGETTVDVKFYNTYGKSSTYYIGDEEDPLDVINLKIKFDIWFVIGTDVEEAIREVKEFIKEKVESLDVNGNNQLHISNLMRMMEVNFSYIDHIRFQGINDYSVQYQTIKLQHQDINEMTTEERRNYIPEMLTIALDDITIVDYTAY